ncbi:MAG TPA: NAD(P)H-dependent oxidoreductase [Steroidobacteraceae bacterium]
MNRPPFVVGIGGTTEPGSSTERALSLALLAAEDYGATVHMIGGKELAALPHYRPREIPSKAAMDLLCAVRKADGIIFASPGYHGSISGLVKNAIDYLEETAKDSRVYLDGVPVGLVVTAYGWQATGPTLAALRAMVHALRGWPTPLGAAIKGYPGLFVNGGCTEPAVATQLQIVGQQVVRFIRARSSFGVGDSRLTANLTREDELTHPSS